MCRRNIPPISARGVTSGRVCPADIIIGSVYYSDVIMGAMASQITSLTIAY